MLNYRNLSKFITLFLGFLFTSFALADQHYLIIDIECNKQEEVLNISLRNLGVENERTLIENLSPNNIAPMTLLSIGMNKKGHYSVRKKLKKSICSLKKDRYEIQIMPFLSPRFNPEGMCATRIGASIQVRLREKNIVKEMYDFCRENGDLVNEIIIRPNKAIELKTIPAFQFLYE